MQSTGAPGNDLTDDDRFQKSRHLVSCDSIFWTAAAWAFSLGHSILLMAGIDSLCPIVLLYKGSVGHLILFVTFVTCIHTLELPRQNRGGC